MYEWEQSLDEVNVYIAPPPGVTAAALDIKIEVSHLRIGLKGNPPFLDVRTPADDIDSCLLPRHLETVYRCSRAVPCCSMWPPLDVAWRETARFGF